MPRLFALAALFVAAPALAQPYWELVASSPEDSYRFEDASFVTPDHGWIVDGSGRVHETLDGGATWTLKSSNFEYLRAAAFVNSTHGWIGALYGNNHLFETTDAGATLINVTSRIAPAISGGICGLFAIDAQTVVGVGQWSGPAYVAKTVDGGATWQSQSVAGLAGSLIDVYFHDAMHGIAVGGTQAINSGSRAVVLGTDDGGATWTRRFVSSGTGTAAEWGWKISFPTPLVGYVSVEYNGDTLIGKVLKTEDGGQTWTELPVPGGRSMQGIGFVTATEGWTSGRGTAMRTLDGGTTWTPTADIDGSVNRFEFFGTSSGFAMGRRIFRLRRTIDDEAPVPVAPALTLSVAPNPAAGAVTLRYTVSAGPARVDVSDVLGRRVATLADGAHAEGTHTAVWTPAGVAPGLYAVRLTVGGAVVTERVVYLPR